MTVKSIFKGLLAAVLAAGMLCSCLPGEQGKPASPFPAVDGTGFVLDGEPYVIKSVAVAVNGDNVMTEDDYETIAGLGFNACLLYTSYYLAFQVEAKRKVSWIHIDYKKSTLSVSLDEEAFAHCDQIVMVSKQCLDNFKELCPKFAAKAVWTENIVSPELIRRAAEKAQPGLPAKASPDVIRLVTVSRVDFSHKGLDRGVEAFRCLKEEGLAERFQWVVIGDGGDMEAFREMISENGLEGLIFPLGMKPEPLPYLKQADAFFLPSRYEGKPISVSEAQILGVPPLRERREDIPRLSLIHI